MKITFNINLSTYFGQEISIKINHKEHTYIHKLNYKDYKTWNLTIFGQPNEFSYSYFIENPDGTINHEYKEKYVCLKNIHKKEAEFFDFFSKSNFPENYLSSKPFQISRNKDVFIENKIKLEDSHIFKISAPLFSKNHELYLLGNHEKLGNWNPENAIKMNETSFGNWEISLDLKNIKEKIEYKYCIINSENNELITYENGENRFVILNENNNKIVQINDVYFKYPENQLWKKAGIAVPIFALKTNESFGIGEFLDLKKLGDFSYKSNIKLIQILPINDTTANYSWTDSYPYSAISVYALHPIYINIPNVKYKMEENDLIKYNNLLEELNSEKFVNYEKVIENKWIFLKLIYKKYKKLIEKDNEFKEYLNKNKHWIYTYSAFCVLRDEYKTPDFSSWGKYSRYDYSKIIKFFDKENPHYDSFLLHAFVQFQLHVQLCESVSYLHSLGISIKGDLPIGIYRNSVEAWAEPKYFNMDFQAGAPPDDFTVLGQNWEFPTYNWQIMKQDNYSWWKNRFQNMQQYFDSFRIDHILGFFRIWKIPTSQVQGILGYFDPAIAFDENELKENGLNINLERFIKPYITSDIIKKYFKENAHKVETTFLEKDSFGNFKFKEKYDNQRKIEEKSKRNSWVKSIKNELFKLISNVILLEENKNNKVLYHPRFALFNTDSFKYLDSENQQILMNLYNNYFFLRNETFWKEQANEKLPVLKKSTKMLTCGEDLGLVPDCVPSVLNELAILSLQVQRMPSSNDSFSDPKNAPYLSVVTTSSHDTSTIRMWWEENQNITQNYYNNQLKKEGIAPKKLNPEIMKIIFQQHLSSKSMLSIFPLQDLMALNKDLYVENKEDERINIPAIFPHYWKYRMHINLENLLENKDFIDLLSSEIKNSSRD